MAFLTALDTFHLNAAGLFVGLIAALLMGFFPPRLPQFTEKGEPILSLTANPTDQGKRWGRCQRWLSMTAPGLLALAFLLQLIALASSLLVSAAPAPVFAQSWVLWHESKDQSKGAMETAEWRIVRADKAARECERELQATLQEYVNTIQQERQKKRLGGTVEATGATFLVKGSDGVTTLHWSRLVCLPDSVDPRGPKGK